MDSEKPEFFKLDEIDRKVLVWLMNHVPHKSVVAWVYYIANEYRVRKAVFMNADKLLDEMEIPVETNADLMA